MAWTRTPMSSSAPTTDTTWGSTCSRPGSRRRSTPTSTCRSSWSDQGFPEVGTAPDGGTTEKVFVSYVDGETEYYGINDDPYEMTNTAGRLDPATVAKYQKAVAAIKACKGTSTCWTAQHMAAP